MAVSILELGQRAAKKLLLSLLLEYLKQVYVILSIGCVIALEFLLFEKILYVSLSGTYHKLIFNVLTSFPEICLG